MTKQTILGFGRGRFVFVVGAMPLLIASGLLTAQPWHEILLALYSVVTLMYLAEGRRAGAACGIFFCLGHGALFFTRGVWGLAVFNALFAAPVYLFSFIAWGRNIRRQEAGNRDQGVVDVKRLTIKGRALVLCVSAALFAGLFLLLRAVGSANAPLDAFTLAVFAPALVLLRGRYLENWVLHFLGNAAAMSIWIINTVQDFMNFNFVLIGAVAVAVNVIGFVTWLKLGRKNGKIC